MKKILLIGTGGTIASGVTAEGLAPELTTEQLLSQVPGISKICAVECRQLFTIDSVGFFDSIFISGPVQFDNLTVCHRTHLHSP